MTFSEKQARVLSGIAMVALAVLAAYLGKHVVAAMVWLISAAALWELEHIFKWKERPVRWLMVFMPLSIIYVLIPGLAALELYMMDPWFLVWAMVVAAATDTFAFLFGPPIGGPKLMPSVSPKKTWAGAIVGAAFATLLGGWFAALFLPAVYDVALVSFALSVAAQIGDLFESKLKRVAGVKDSSRLIPGHGGVLDRFDSLFFVLPALLSILMFV